MIVLSLFAYSEIQQLLSGSIEFTPEDVAALFCGLNCQGMADFFTEVARISDSWSNGGLSMQLQYVKDSEYSTLDGRYVMSKIGEYS